MLLKSIISTILFSFFYFVSIAQINIDSIGNLDAANYLQSISEKSKELSKKIDAKSEIFLARFQKHEQKLKRRLMKLDSLAANNIFTKADESYKKLAAAYKSSTVAQYIPRFDSLATSLKFLQANPQLISQVKEAKEKLEAANSKLSELRSQLAKAENIKEFIKQRKQYLKQQLGKYGFARQLKKLNKDAYYYASQLNEYKEMIKDPKKMGTKILALLSKSQLFKKFMNRHSEYAALFPMPNFESAAQPGNSGGFAALQTRAQVSGIIQQQFGGANVDQFLMKNIKEATSEVSSLSSSENGALSGNGILPENFKPNTQRGKTLWKRLEYSTNIQTNKSNGLFPASIDMGLSLGYKLNDKSIIGIGSAYKLGLGGGWQHVALSSEGASIRGFLDWSNLFEKSKISVLKELNISGGFEMNYQKLPGIMALQHLNSWQQSGLIGFTKIGLVKSSFFKATKVQIFWDFLSYRQMPRARPVLIRFGYNF